MEESTFVAVEIPAMRSASTFDPRFLYLHILSDDQTWPSLLSKTITESRYDGSVIPAVLCASVLYKKAATTQTAAMRGAKVCAHGRESFCRSDINFSDFLSDPQAHADSSRLQIKKLVLCLLVQKAARRSIRLVQRPSETKNSRVFL